MCTDVLILAGGSGERLWPVSDAKKPKQFMSLGDGDSFLQSAIRKAFSLGISGNICIVTRKDWTDLVVQDVLDLSERMKEPSLLAKTLVMSEPRGRNTAPAIAWTARYLLSLKRSEPVNILMMASDHIIKPADAFISDAELASSLANEGNLVTFSIPPASPATGYGYIKAGAQISVADGSSGTAFKVDSFKEKPDAATARAWVEDGHYFWNSGLYAFRADFFLSELAEYSPEIAKAFENTGTGSIVEHTSGVGVMTVSPGIAEAYEQTPAVSIDYAVSEKSKKTVSVRASFLWDDVGTWDSLAAYFDGYPENAAPVDTRNCFVQSDIPVALCGVDDLVVVIKNGKALVARRGETNLVKDALSILKQKGLA